MKLALAAFTPGGAALSARVRAALPGHEFTVLDKSAESAREWTRKAFASSDALIFIGATGLAVRLIAPFLQGKDQDPAVLALDEAGRFVIPLLSGHIGGANRLARELAAALGAEAVITTATDVNGLFAVDEWAALHGCAITDISQVKHVAAALLAGREVGFACDFAVSGALPAGFTEGRSEAGVSISLDEGKKPYARTLNLVPRMAVLGAGCRKGMAEADFEEFALSFLAEAGVSPLALCKLASIDIKQDEPCLVEFAQKRGIAFEVFSAETLAALPGEFGGSDFVRSVTGVDNVCERAAVAAGAVRFIRRKITRAGITLALGFLDWRAEFGDDGKIQI